MVAVTQSAQKHAAEPGVGFAEKTVEADGCRIRYCEAGQGDVLLAFHSELHRGGELGWVLDPAYSGHGYATEAAHAVMHLAFDGLGLHRLTARVDARNPASSRLAERLGMRCEAHQISNEWFKGEWTDELDYALLESEWADQHRDGPGSCSWPLLDEAGRVA